MPLICLICDRCGRNSNPDGELRGSWTCGPCVREKEVARKAQAVLRTMESRLAYRSGKNKNPLCPGRTLPPETTDEEVQRIADENYGIEWERREDKVIIWCEM